MKLQDDYICFEIGLLEFYQEKIDKLEEEILYNKNKKEINTYKINIHQKFKEKILKEIRETRKIAKQLDKKRVKLLVFLRKNHRFFMNILIEKNEVDKFSILIKNTHKRSMSIQDITSKMIEKENNQFYQKYEEICNREEKELTMINFLGQTLSH